MPDENVADKNVPDQNEIDQKEPDHDAVPSTSRQNIDTPVLQGNNIVDQVIDDVIGTSLKQFPFDLSNPGIKAHLYDDYIRKYPYDVFLLLITDEIVTFIVKETIHHAEQQFPKEKPISGIKNGPL
ncbi:hypothetical protein JTB14_028518 [Gonioctena quinquepunctata]|nr:hypothetical protein JTB14_028518 [Gonioctena quinquepunctata]